MPALLSTFLSAGLTKRATAPYRLPTHEQPVGLPAIRGHLIISAQLQKKETLRSTKQSTPSHRLAFEPKKSGQPDLWRQPTPSATPEVTASDRAFNIIVKVLLHHLIYLLSAACLRIAVALCKHSSTPCSTLAMLRLHICLCSLQHTAKAA